ncbi:TPA: type II toxin-antitoxin system HicA family toxin [Morganella morganii]|uniref:type II toxin-antitoxin system HicA family toxin n=1 Tax=Morganella morganii TaxID=582 RepID=UPI0037F09210
MFKKLSPLTYREITTGLKKLGFTLKRTTSSHEQWEKKDGSTKWLVTVDEHHSPFSRDLIKSMARQAGVNSKLFHALCKGAIGAAEVIGEELSKE